jgi:hypothetical protein
MRYSLASLFVAVLFVALGCLALVNASDLVRDITITVTVALLMVATHAAFFAGKRWRDFAGGFAVIGWLYFFVAFSIFFFINNGAESKALIIRRGLLTGRVVKWVYVGICDARQPANPYQGWTPAPEDPNILLRPIEEAPAPNDDTKDLTRTLPDGKRYREWDVTWGRPPASIDFVDQDTFADVGQCLWTLVLGALGGLFAVVFAAARQAPRLRSHDPPAADDEGLAGHEA